MAEVRVSTVVPLNEGNFMTWKVQIKMSMMREDLWGFINGHEAVPDISDSNYKKYCTRRDRALSLIVMAIEPKLLYLIGDPTDPKEVFDKLSGIFQKKTFANKLRLRKRLYSVKFDAKTTMHNHLKCFVEIFSELAVLGDALEDEDKVIHLLASLPDDYDTIVTAIETQEKVPSWEAISEKLLNEELKKKNKEEKPNALVTASGNASSTTQAANKTFKCFGCGKTGHIKKNCYFTKNKKTKNKPASANSAETKEYDSCGLSVYSNTAITGTEDWIIDSGASRSMTNNRNNFKTCVDLAQPTTVKVGDGRELQATGIGTVILKSRVSSDEVREIKLINCLFVPELAYNLVSVAQQTKFGWKTVFSDKDCQICNEAGEVEALGKKSNGLYFLNLNNNYSVNSAVTEPVSQTDLWHQRFCHLHGQGLDKLVRERLVNGMTNVSSKQLSFCEHCAYGKQHRTPFPKKSDKKSTKPLELIHSDVCGKVSLPSLSGCQYFVTFIDDYTHYVWVYVMKTKDQVFEKFKEFKVLVEKQTGFKIKSLRTDNGGEYTSSIFEAFLSSEGIRHQKTVPKNPEQNGVAERMNRSLVEAVRTMLSDASLPRRFWAEALSTAVYLRNISPTSALVGKTPFEALTNVKPNVEHLRVFGCVAYAHIPKDERQKLDVKSVKCILLGYGSECKAYRLYNLEKRVVFYSRDVIFNESQRFNSEKESHTPDTLHRGNNSDSNSFQQVELPVDVHETEPIEPEAVPNEAPKRIRRAPDRYGEWVSVSEELGTEPVSYNDAMNSPECEAWKQAMRSEIESMKQNSVWNLVELPKDRTPVACKWVFKKKLDSNGEVVKFKARLVAKGYSQKYPEDYSETFSPVTRFDSVRTIVALAAQHDLHIQQMDVTSAFLNGELEEDIYMMQPEGFAVKGQKNLVCKLNKSIYGLKQSPRCWNQNLDAFLKELNFIQSKSDPCVYTRINGELMIIAIYVDDIVIAGKSVGQIDELKEKLKCKYKLSDLGDLKYFLGVKVDKLKNGSFFLSQEAFTRRILQTFRLADANPVKTPVDINVKLRASDEKSKLCDPVLYQSAIGSLLYLSGKTRPDVAFIVNKLARFCAKPSVEHMSAVKRVLRYIKGTINFGLLYSKQKSDDCVGYCDSDWAGDVEDRKSTSGYSFQLGGAAISWNSTKQSCVALSTAEAEYVALSHAAQEAAWLNHLLSDLKYSKRKPMVIYEDNTAAICIANDSQCNKKTKHIDLRFHYIRDQIYQKKICLEYCKSEDMVADILTKGLSPDKFLKLRTLIGVISSPL